MTKRLLSQPVIRWGPEMALQFLHRWPLITALPHRIISGWWSRDKWQRARCPWTSVGLRGVWCPSEGLVATDLALPSGPDLPGKEEEGKKGHQEFPKATRWSLHERHDIRTWPDLCLKALEHGSSESRSFSYSLRYEPPGPLVL